MLSPPEWGQLVRTRSVVQGEMDPTKEYPPGTLGAFLEVLNEDAGIWLVELRFLNSRLVGGYFYDVVAIARSDLDLFDAGNTRSKDDQ